MTASEPNKLGQANEDFSSQGRHICTLAAVVIVLCAWSSLFLLLWNVDRGLDLTDEANLLYFYRHPYAFLENRYWQHFGFIHAIVPSGLDHVITYRVIKLAGLVGLTGLFAAILAKWTARRFGFLSGYGLHPVALLHFLAIGSFMAYCHGSQTLSYNDFTTFCLLGVAIALLSIDLNPSQRNRLQWNFLFSLLAGGVLLLLFFAKWSSGILLAVYFCVFAYLANSDRRWRALLTSVAGAVSGAAVLALTLTDAGFGTIFSFSKLWIALSDQANLREHGGPPEILRHYVETTAARFAELVRNPAAIGLLVLPIATVVASAAVRSAKARRVWIGVLGAAGLLSLVIFASEVPGWILNHAEWFNRFKIADLQTFAVVFAVIGACCCVPAAAHTVERRKLVAFLLAAALIAALPAVGAIGTNNALLTQFIRHMAPLFAALALLTAFLGFAGRWRPFAPVVCAVVALLSTAQLASIVLLYPYRLARPGLEQTIALTAPRHLEGLKVDAVTHAFIDDLLVKSRRAVGETAGMPVLAMFDLPGVVYILKAVSVGHPWHLPGAAMQQATCDRLQADPLVRTRLRLIALDRDVPAAIVECLRQSGLDLASYTEVARVELPPQGTAARQLRLLVPRESRVTP